VRRLALLAVVVLAAGCGGSHKSAPPTPSPRLTFDYNGKTPLVYEDNGVVLHRGPIQVHDISYVSRGKQIDGFLVERKTKGSMPAVVLVHGAGGDRTELLGDAVELARLGFVAMTITAPSSFASPQPTTVQQLVDQSKSVTIDDVVAVRRAADVLESLPFVDGRRIGYLGWSNGAKTGAFVAASDQRFRALALLSAGADKLAAFVKAAPAGQRDIVRAGLGSVDPLRYMARARPGTILLVDGRKDQIVPRAALENMINAAPRGTVVRWYDAGHELTAAAYRDTFAWLASRLHP
jgi:dienelactone hydrolase